MRALKLEAFYSVDAISITRPLFVSFHQSQLPRYICTYLGA